MRAQSELIITAGKERFRLSASDIRDIELSLEESTLLVAVTLCPGEAVNSQSTLAYNFLSKAALGTRFSISVQAPTGGNALHTDVAELSAKSREKMSRGITPKTHRTVDCIKFSFKARVLK